MKINLITKLAIAIVSSFFLLLLVKLMAGVVGSIPVIDLKYSKNKLIEACEEWGCFQIINHNIPQKLMLDMKVVIRSLFDLPIEIKRRNTDVIPGSGYLGPEEDRPLHEAFGIYGVDSSDAVEAFCTQVAASPEQRVIIKSYSHALYELIMEIVSKLAESMGLNCDFAKEWPCQLRMNKYNFTQETTIGSTGIGIHTDSGFLTILQADDCVGGLEVMNKSSGEFIAVDPSPGSLFVNLGDTATGWSNGRFCNVKHGVQCKWATTRVSIALFLFAPKDEVVEAPPEFVDSNHPRLYKPFTYEELRKLRNSTKLRAGEALELLRLETDQPLTK